MGPIQIDLTLRIRSVPIAIFPPDEPCMAELRPLGGERFSLVQIFHKPQEAWVGASWEMSPGASIPEAVTPHVGPA